MPESIPDKNVQVDGKVIGANSVIKMTAKTAIWIISGIVGIVMTILTWSYFDLRSEVRSANSEAQQKRDEFVHSVDEKVEKMNDDIQTIRLDQRDIKGDIKLILDRQTRDNPVITNPNISVESITPPSE
ncbi:MAG TPA: hypothetical protein VMZ29_05275 [Candidatus Bathyarchaeia archaeon]|jgi:hypothetical protein|nr:hypothetical protein [Candidatus Bathyarchaeia archaeon]